MKTIYTYIIILLGLIQVTNINAQTITKTASKSSVYIGEEFTYTIAIENINNFSDLDQIVDDFGLDTDILAVRYGPSIQLLTTWQFCSGVSHTFNSTATSNELIVNFNNCSGSTSMVNRLYIEVDVRLNELACNLTIKHNRADLVLKNQASPISAKHDLPIDFTNPLELQKSFFKYDNGYLYYDIRLSSKTGNFRYLDFSSESFFDEFTIPSCFQNVSANDIETVYHPGGNRTIETPVTPNSRSFTGNQLSIDWSFPSSVTEMDSSILFSVKIKVTDCQCTNLFDLNNRVSFKFQNVCGTDFNMNDSFDLQGLTCDIENSLPSDCKLEFTKDFMFYDNDLGLTMKGCEGEYIIKVKNCSTNLEFEKIILSDLIPSELDVLGVDSGAWSHNLSGNQMTLNANLSPGDSLQVKIKFKVNTNLPNKNIENCAEIDIWGSHMYTNAPIQLNKTECTDFKTVPNEVAVVTRKSICSTADKDCGTLQINDNNYLPNDEVEYELFFYNYGNKGGENVTIVDRLPNYLRVQNPSTDIKVYKAKSGDPDLIKSCEVTDYRDITNSVHINYSSSGLNQLDIKLGNHILDAFTCKGVSFYKVVVKGKIEQNAQSGVYDNQFVVEYNAPPSSIRKTAISQNVSYSINIDNLILGYKQSPIQIPDCENHTITATYRVLVANMGTMPVNVDIVDALQGLPTNVGIVRGPSNFKSITLSGTTTLPNPPLPSTALITNTTFSNFSSTNTGFSIIREPLAPCTALLLEYDVVFDTELLNEGELERVCNDVNIWAYTGNRRITPRIFQKSPKKYNNNIVVSLDPALNALYTNAQTSQERLDAILLMKLKKANPEIIKKPNNFNTTRFQNMNLQDRIRRYPWFTGTYFGNDTYEDVCVKIEDCLAGKESGCLNSSETNDVSLEITGINTTTGEINTQLTTNPSKKISRIEYILSDVEFEEFCNDEVFYLGPRRIYVPCRRCDGNLAGEFRPTNLNGISGLNYSTNTTNNFSSINATYKEWNTAYYEGSPTTITTVNKDFMLPNIGNCSGNYAVSITAIVYFEDCTSCYASDVIDFRTNYNWLIPDVHTGTNLGGGTPIIRGPFISR